MVQRADKRIISEKFNKTVNVVKFEYLEDNTQHHFTI